MNLEGAEEKTNISSGGETINNEVVVGLEPDLVLAPNTVDNETVRSLRDAGLTVYHFDEAKSIAGIQEKTRIIGALTGECAAAEDTVDWMDAELATVDAAVEGQDRPGMIYTFFGWTAGNGTFIGTLVESAPARSNVAAEAGIEGYEELNEEVLVDQDPDWILLNSDDDQVPKTAAYNGTTAVQKDQILVVNYNQLEPSRAAGDLPARRDDEGDASGGVRTGEPDGVRHGDGHRDRVADRDDRTPDRVARHRDRGRLRHRREWSGLHRHRRPRRARLPLAGRRPSRGLRMAEQSSDPTVVSTSPSGTEILCSLGVEPAVVSGSCDHPPSVTDRPRLDRSRVDGATSAERDDQASFIARGVRRRRGPVARGRTRPDPHPVGLWRLRRRRGPRPRDSRRRTRRPEVLGMRTSDLPSVLDTIETVGAAVGREDRAARLVGQPADCFATVESITAEADDRPSVAVFEWLDPLHLAANWVPRTRRLRRGATTRSRTRATAR